jgi:hypothetical protein
MNRTTTSWPPVCDANTGLPETIATTVAREKTIERDMGSPFTFARRIAALQEIGSNRAASVPAAIARYGYIRRIDPQRV